MERKRGSLRPRRDVTLGTKDVIEASGLAILDVDSDRRITYVSAALADLLKRRPDELLGLPGVDLIHPDDLPKTTDAFQRRLAGEFVPPYRMRVLASDGEVIPVELYVSVLRNDSDDVVGLRCIVFDQRPLEEANRRLAQTESTLRGILEASPDLAYTKDREGRFTWVSSSFAERAGMSEAEILGRTAREAFGPEIAANVEEDDRQALEGRMVVSERWMSYKGRSAVFQFFKAPLLSPGGEVIGIAGFMRDVTDRYQEQERTKLNEQRYRAVSQLVAGYVLSMKINPDGSGEIEWLEGDFEGIIGRPAEGFYENGGLRTVVHPEDKEILDRRRKRIFSGHPSTDEFRIVRPDGEVRWLRAFAGPETDEDGNVIRVYAAVADITAHKQLEERAKVVSRFESLGQIAAGLGHDMSNLLQSLLTNLELAQRRLDRGAPKEEVRELIEKSISRLDAMRDLVRGLVQFATDEGTAEQTDVAKETRRITSLLKESLRSGIELKTRFASRALPVRMSAGALQQLLTNLLLNAADAMPKGGTIQVNVRSIRLRRPKASPLGLYVPPGEYALIRVSDTGTGIEEGMLNRIFEPFVTTRRDEGHSGLGLATVLRHVAAAGGCVTVENNPSGGATFRVYVPIAGAEQQSTRALVQLPVVILVVDDDSANRSSIEQTLLDAGYVVLSAGSCEEAKEIAIRRARPIDCILADLSLPDGCGDELGQSLVSEAFALRYALMTSQSPTSYSVPVLRKPFTQKELLQFVEDQLAQPAVS
ncbi:MAG: hypothetical protein KatS3mg015_0083 [Fimbriimonadales bacterium]|nr:MAG: hypothetical protein KatS3mg015_0083 [Fimbriimonadales bacterium]